MNYERMHNVTRTLLFNTTVPSGGSGYLDAPIVGHGRVKGLRVRFAAGEDGELHIRPVMILPPDIPIELLQYAQGGAHYVSGDDETFTSDIGYETENDAICRVYYENVSSDPTAADAVVDVQIEVEYFDYYEPANIIGPAAVDVRGGVLF